jgi:hypothetical protein
MEKEMDLGMDKVYIDMVVLIAYHRRPLGSTRRNVKKNFTTA